MPTAASATLATPPVPNPVAYPGAPNQILASGQYNTNFYNLWSYLATIAAQLNSCSYAPGATLTGITSTYPVSASIAACNPGYGAIATLGLAHGDYEDLTSAQTITGARAFNAGITGTSFSFSGVGGVASLQIGPAAATTANFIAHGTTNTYPFDGTVYNGNNHFEHWSTSATTGGTAHTFSGPFSSSSSYHCFATGRTAFGTFAFNTYSATGVSLFSQTGTVVADAFCVGY